MEVECPGCARPFRVGSNAEITVEYERRADDNYALHAICLSDAPRSSVHVYVEDVELGQSQTEYFSQAIRLGLGVSSIEDPSALGERLTVIHECIHVHELRLLEALVECARCHATFSYEYSGEGLVTEEPLQVEWEQLYDGRLRAWSVGTQILPEEAPVPRHPIRLCVHECEPEWPDDIR